MANWPGSITAITLFVEDLIASKNFYSTVFDLPIHYEDDVSVVFKFENTLINLLSTSEVAELIGPASLAPQDSGNRMQFTITVADVDSACEKIKANGVKLLTGPIDRPWGIRTASFQDPAGHIWEIAH
jgi:lactoylglutathione lyase